MTLEEQALGAFNVLLAALLSMLIGIERERRRKAAGIRTHMLVGIGACLFTVLSFYAFPGSDTSRIAANVVTGIGFLGAGIIFKEEGAIHDLTTAASIWTTAAIGMAVGAGAWFLAICITLIVWVVLAILQAMKSEVI